MTADSSRSKVLAILIALAVLLSGQLVLSGCEVRHEPDPDGGPDDVQVEVDGEAIEATREAASEAGRKIGDAANSAAETVREAVDETAETIDDNVDVGENARDGDG